MIINIVRLGVLALLVHRSVRRYESFGATVPKVPISASEGVLLLWLLVRRSDYLKSRRFHLEIRRLESVVLT